LALDRVSGCVIGIHDHGQLLFEVLASRLEPEYTAEATHNTEDRRI
jgi:peptide subunit release factor RF-3